MQTYTGSSVHMGFPRQEYWSGLPFPSPGDLPNQGIKPRSPALQADSLLSEPPRSPVYTRVYVYTFFSIFFSVVAAHRIRSIVPCALGRICFSVLCSPVCIHNKHLSCALINFHALVTFGSYSILGAFSVVKCLREFRSCDLCSVISSSSYLHTSLTYGDQCPSLSSSGFTPGVFRW